MQQFHPFTRIVIWFALALLVLYVGYYLFLILPLDQLWKYDRKQCRNELDQEVEAFLRRHQWGQQYQVPCSGIADSRLQLNLTAEQLHELAAEFHLHRPTREELMQSNEFERQFNHGPAQCTDQDFRYNCSVCTYTRKTVVLLPVPDADSVTSSARSLTPHGYLSVERIYWDPKTHDTCIDLEVRSSH